MGQLMAAVLPAMQYVLAGHTLALPATQKEPAAHRAEVPLTHTLLAGHASHSQPPSGSAALVTWSRPALQMQVDPMSDEFDGQPHCDKLEEPATEYMPTGQRTSWAPPGQ